LLPHFYFKKSGQENLKSWKYWGFKEKKDLKSKKISRLWNLGVREGKSLISHIYNLKT
jgi:hypothetical protein